MARSFPPNWFNGLSKKDADDLETNLKNSQIVEILRKIIASECQSISKATSSDYDTPSWSHKQAHRNGMVEALRKIEKLLTFDQKE